MKRTGIAIELKADRKGPIFLELATSIIRSIERGRLKPGVALPGTRALARHLKLHRNTVDAAYHELIMQGWLVTEPSRGTFVARDLPDIGRVKAKTRNIAAISRAHSEDLASSRLHVSDGAPDARLMPRVELARAFRRALAAPSFLAGASYGDPRGAASLRQTLAGYLVAERGLTASADDVLVTHGSQMGLFLAAAALIEPGQMIAVENPGYPHAWAAFRAAGANVIGIPVDAHGIDVEKLAKLAERNPNLKAVYVTPHHQYPTTVTLGAARRLRLLDLARRHRLTVIEDDYDHEYRFNGRPILPLATRADPEVPVIYVGSLSKLLAPVVRIGYVIAPRATITRMADRREAIDRQGDVPLEQALAMLIEDGDLSRHARKARRIYECRRDFLAEAIKSRFGDDLAFDLPAGGLAIWVRAPARVSAETWALAAARAGLSIEPGIRFALDATRAPEAFRLGYAALDEKALNRVVSLLARTRPPPR